MVYRNDNPLSEYLDSQYLEAPNKKDIDYHAPYARLIAECVELRHDEDLTQAELAHRMATKQSVISRFENLDGRLPSYDFIARLAIALGHSPGMTLYGDFMAKVPLEKQAFVRELAAREGIPTQRLVEIMLEKAILAYQRIECRAYTFSQPTQAETHARSDAAVSERILPGVGDDQKQVLLAEAS